MWAEMLVLFAAGGVALAVFAWRGCLRRDALRGGPTRRTGLGPADLAMGLGLWLVGQALAGLVIVDLLGVEREGGLVSAESPLSQGQFVLLSQVLVYLLPVGYAVLRVGVWQGFRRGSRELGLLPRGGWGEARLTGLAILGGLPVVAAVLLVTRLVSELLGLPTPPIAHNVLEYIRTMDAGGEFILLVVAVVVVAAVVEEIVFRGLVQSSLAGAMQGHRRWTVVLIAATLFAGIHFQYVNGVPAWQGLPGLFVLGVMLGWVYERSGSLWPAIGLHGAFNALNVLLVRVGEL